MERIERRACAKLNLTLDILGRRPDGYHDLRMVMQSVSLSDAITILPGAEPGVHAATSLPFLPAGEKNLAVIAARRFWAAAGLPEENLCISIEKAIPVCAGLAGGSADAAAVLRALNEHYGMPLSEEELLAAAAEVGSDVPFCVLGGTALAEGRGERLTPLRPLPECAIVLCKPPFSVSTPELFRAADAVKLRCHPDTAGMLDAVARGDLPGICRRMYNVFEDVLPEPRAGTVREIKHILLEHGALGACMSGTGPTVFGIFGSETGASSAFDDLKRDWPDTFLTRPVPAA